MIRILSIEQAGPSFYIWIEQNDSYINCWAKEECFEEKERYSMKDYRDYEHFAGVIGKFKPYTVFLKDPIQINELSYQEVKKTYDSIPK